MPVIAAVVFGLAVLLLAAWRLLKNQEIIMGQLEDIAASFAESLPKLAGELSELHAELAASQAANQSPAPETMARLKSLADSAKALADANAAPAPSPATSPAPDPSDAAAAPDGSAPAAA